MNMFAAAVSRLRRGLVAIVVAGVLASVAAAARADVPAAPARRTYANPVDIDYRYNFEQVNEGISYRTGADPVIVRHGDAYYLFMTLADGYWRSTNLLDWTFIEPSRWPFDSMVAPAVASDGERLLVMRAMFEPGPILETTDPAHGHLDFLTRRTPELPYVVPPGWDRDLPAWHTGDAQPTKIPPGPWDPDLFRDDDGRWYLYWGSSDHFPLFGIEMTLDHGARYLGKPRALIALDPQLHGWERFGRDHGEEQHAVYIEGAWMTKANGRYYLQYAAPGTEFNAYATGTYVGSSPLGPFTYAANNPVGYKPGGFVEGVGHGNTFQDAAGNWWNTGTSWVGLNWPFERRIGLYAATFDDEGMHVDTRFGDFPHFMPTQKVTDPAALFTGWMLLSYRKPVVASSTLAFPKAPAFLDTATAYTSFAAANVTDENPRTFWVAARNAPGETLTVDLGAAKTVRAVQVNFTDYEAGRFADAADIYTEFQLEASLDGKAWQPVARTQGPRRDRPNAYLELATPVRARFVRYVHGHVGAAQLAISDLRVFGNADGRPPEAPRGVEAQRGADVRDATVRWRAVPGVVGYNVRWGVHGQRLAQCYQVFVDRGTTLTLRALSRGVAYDVAVEAFNETGVSALSPTVALP